MTASELIAAHLSALTGARIMPLDDANGFRVKETPTHYIDVLEYIFNFRVVTVPKTCPLTLDGEWCYYGEGVDSLLRAVGAAVAWDGTGDPPGWERNAKTGEYAR